MPSRGINESDFPVEVSTHFASGPKDLAAFGGRIGLEGTSEEPMPLETSHEIG